MSARLYADQSQVWVERERKKKKGHAVKNTPANTPWGITDDSITATELMRPPLKVREAFVWKWCFIASGSTGAHFVQVPKGQERRKRWSQAWKGEEKKIKWRSLSVSHSSKIFFDNRYLKGGGERKSAQPSRTCTRIHKRVLFTDASSKHRMTRRRAEIFYFFLKRSISNVTPPHHSWSNNSCLVWRNPH